MIKKITGIKPEIRKELLNEWLNSASRLYGAAFH